MSIDELAGGTRPHTSGPLNLNKSRLNITEDRIVFMFSAFNVKYRTYRTDNIVADSLLQSDAEQRRAVSLHQRSHGRGLRGVACTSHHSPTTSTGLSFVRGCAVTSPQSLNNSRSSSAVTSPEPRAWAVSSTASLPFVQFH